MEKELNIQIFRDKLESIYSELIIYSNRIKPILDELEIRTSLMLPKPKDHYWKNLPKEEQIAAEQFSKEIIELIRKIIPFIKRSPLVSDADLHELSLKTKKIRAALYLRFFQYNDPEILHDEGVVMGFSPANQTEDTPIDVAEALNIIEDSFSSIYKIIDLVVPGEGSDATISIQSQKLKKYRPNTAFIMMWMDSSKSELDDVNDTIKEVFISFGITALRADDIEHEDLITKRILDEIETSEFLIADLTGERPSVYYEVGYAHSLGKRVILFRKRDTELHFDLSVHNCPEYKNLGELKKKLTNRLKHILNQIQ